MKLINQILFFTVFISVLVLVNFYILRRGLDVLNPHYKTIYYSVFILFVFSFPLGRLFEKLPIPYISQIFTWIGAIWMAFMLYFFLPILLLDLLRLLNHFFHFFPAFITENYETAKKITAIAIITISVAFVALGHINTYFPKITTLNLNIDKKAGALKQLNIVMVSDIHLGSILGSSFLERIAEITNKLNPDIILFAGDVVDEDIGSILKDHVAPALAKFKSRYGVFAITGNHEYFSGVNAASKYLSEHGVVMLRDSVVLIDNSFYLAGREDRQKNSHSSGRRKELPEILNGVDNSLPILLMDHQPFKLEEAINNKIDLQLSGHTHNGQLWPFNYLIDRIYEVGWGYKKIDNTHFYVSCGVGTWGPPVRTGSRPEVVNIILRFKQ